MILSYRTVLHCSPRDKQTPAARLAAAALANVYGRTDLVYEGPTYASSRGAVDGQTLLVTVTFRNETLGRRGLINWALHFDHCPAELHGHGGESANGVGDGVYYQECAWYSIKASNGKHYNATASIVNGGRQLLLNATPPAGVAGVHPIASQFGYGKWPVVTVYNTELFPMMPWNRSVDTQAAP